MPLAAGVRIGSYQVVGALGQGGMGEVYRAHDTRLGRDVALKILPEALAQDPDRLARFEREAQVLASLNHPNIAQIHGVEDVGAGVLGVASGTVLVLELVEGPTLADMIGSGLVARGSGQGVASSLKPQAASLSASLAIARQIAEALEAAHAQGIVHRDLKPSNVKVKADGTVKVLDFGLAKALAPTPVESVSTAIAESPTLTSPAVTQRGVILGTPAYMAPEQARGKAVDRRADIWAFGCVVYEMLTGSRPFDGDDVSEVLARIIDREPDWTRLPPNLPPVFAAVLRQCLQKNPKQRVHDIADVRLALDGAFEVPAASAPTPSARWPLAARIAAIGLAIVAIGAATVAWYGRSTPAATATASMRLDVDLGPDLVFGSSVGPVVQISPTGERLVMLANGRLVARRVGQQVLVALPGTEGASGFFLSPDGTSVAFVAGGKLKKVTLDGGAVVTICDLETWRGGSWSEDGSMVVAPGGLTSLSRILATGGGLVEFTKLATDEVTHRWPQSVPGGRGVLFTVHTLPAGFDTARIEYVAFADGSRKPLVQNATFGRMFIGADGSAYLLFVREGTIFAAPFDLEGVRVTGAEFPVVEGVNYNQAVGSAQFDASRTGTLIYRRQVPRRLDWLERSGPPSVLVDQSGDYRTASLSPDGSRLAYLAGKDLLVRDLERGTSTRVARGVKGVHFWVPPDGQFIVLGDATTDLLWVRADGSTEPQVLLGPTPGVLRAPTDVNHDGTRLAFMELRTGEPGTWNLWTAPLKVEGAALRVLKPEPFLATRFDERNLVFSGDGRLVAYASNEAGPEAQVFIRMLPDDGRKWQVSIEGGQFPHFGGDRSLFFVNPNDIVMWASYAFAANALTRGAPELWSQQPVGPMFLPFTVDRRGTRVAAIVPDPASKTRSERYLTFWVGAFDEIRRQDPGR